MPKARALQMISPKLVPRSMLQYQGYEHVAANCLSPSKIALINRLHVVESKSESDEFTIQPGEVHSDVDEEITGDDISLICIRPMLSIHLSVVR